jgi:hypothetical protein
VYSLDNLGNQGGKKETKAERLQRGSHGTMYNNNNAPQDPYEAQKMKSALTGALEDGDRKSR